MREIIAVIRRYLPLEALADGHYRTCCPFHSERTSSLMVFPQGQRWECLGCGLGGDLIAFVAKYEHRTRRAAEALIASWGETDG